MTPRPSVDVELGDEAATVRLGRRLGALLAPGDLIVLDGDLGAGKTTLTRAIARGLGLPESVPVTSPTFGIVHEYAPGEGVKDDAGADELRGLRVPLVHADLYRLSGDLDVEEVGLTEWTASRRGVVVVEWGRGFADALGPATLEIALGFRGELGRTARLVPGGARGEEILMQLAGGGGL